MVVKIYKLYPISKTTSQKYTKTIHNNSYETLTVFLKSSLFLRAYQRARVGVGGGSDPPRWWIFYLWYYLNFLEHGDNKNRDQLLGLLVLLLFLNSLQTMNLTTYTGQPLPTVLPFVNHDEGVTKFSLDGYKVTPVQSFPYNKGI